MSDASVEKRGWRQRASHEIKAYLLNVVYLTLIFGSFDWYKRLILAQHDVSYFHYGAALIEALILAKVVMIGDLLHIGRMVTGRPLIVPTIYRAVMFSIWVALFKVLEHAIVGALQGKGIAGGLDEMMSQSPYAMLAMTLVTVFAFIPFFAFKELGQALGEGKIAEMFLRR
jgi:hypothetical protein